VKDASCLAEEGAVLARQAGSDFTVKAGILQTEVSACAKYRIAPGTADTTLLIRVTVKVANSLHGFGGMGVIDPLCQRS
jgi:hypothetical protein